MIAASFLAQQAKFLPTPTLFVDGLAIATFKDKAWTPISGPIKPELPFKVYLLDLVRVTQTASVYELEFAQEVEGNFIPNQFFSDVLWSGPKPKYPRSIRTVNPEQSEYKNLVAEFYKSETKKNPDFEIEINSIARCDLDGNGQEEVLIEAQSKGFSDEFNFEPSPKGQLSCTLLRHIKNGKPITEKIFFFSREAKSDVEPIQITHLKSIADFNGDGNYEVIVTADYYEGQSAHVYNLIKGQFKHLVENGAGA